MKFIKSQIEIRTVINGDLYYFKTLGCAEMYAYKEGEYLGAQSMALGFKQSDLEKAACIWLTRKGLITQ